MDRTFKTTRYDRYGKPYKGLKTTTLRRTGLEPVLAEALKRKLPIVDMALGNPNAYWNPNAGEDNNGHLRPNPTLMDSIREALGAEHDKISCGYTTSAGVPELLEVMKRANLSDPASVLKDPKKFENVRTVITAGGSEAAQVGMAPLLLAPGDKLAVHRWIYIIHLGVAYKEEAELVDFALRKDGVPDPQSLNKLLKESKSNGKGGVQCVVCTTIGNPIGSAMSREAIVETMQVIKEQSEVEKRPIVAFFDTAYEAFRPDGAPLDPIEIAIDEGIEIPVGVFETASKGYGLCGLRLGALRLHWTEGHYPDYRHDYFNCLDYLILPRLGLVPVHIQLGLLNYLKKMESDSGILEQNKRFFRERREKVNANLLKIATALDGIPGVYVSTHYDHNGELDNIDPRTLASFYVTFGLDNLARTHGSGFNQAQRLAEFSLEQGIPVINCVPGTSFLPQRIWAEEPSLIRVTALTNERTTNMFLETVERAARDIR